MNWMELQHTCFCKVKSQLLISPFRLQYWRRWAKQTSCTRLMWIQISTRHKRSCTALVQLRRFCICEKMKETQWHFKKRPRMHCQCLQQDGTSRTCKSLFARVYNVYINYWMNEWMRPNKMLLLRLNVQVFVFTPVLCLFSHPFGSRVAAVSVYGTKRVSADRLWTPLLLMEGVGTNQTSWRSESLND